jgi:signal transduction histidine kinase
VAAAVKMNAERLSWLITNLQRLARLEDHVDTPSHQLVELGTIAMEVARQLGEMAAAHNVTIDFDRQLPAVYGDPAQIELVLLNLVSNAIKYSDRSKAQSIVQIAAQSDGAGREVTISVRDNGIGIPDADQPAIFERFFRAHSQRDDELGVTGTGLGLAIAAECVRGLGGSIRCESAVGEGTTFFITLPSGSAYDLGRAGQTTP